MAFVTTAVRPDTVPSNLHNPPKRRKLRGPDLRRYLFMSLLGVFFVFPIVFMFIASFKPDGQLLRDVSSFRAFVPYGDLSLDNYTGVFERVPAARFIFNSLFISTLTVALGLFVNSLAGFALSRLTFRGSKAILIFIIATLIVPFETIAVPLLLVVSRLPWIGFDAGSIVLQQGWLNTYHVQILPFVANAFAVFLFAQSFRSIPKELDEAARVDGASWFKIYWKIAVPLSGPTFATVAILTFLPIWNAYLWPLMVTQSSEVRPVMVGLQYFFQLNVAWGEIMAYLSMITIPVLVIFLSFQRAFIESVAASGVKG